MIRDPKKSIWIATLPLAASATSWAQMSPAEAAEAGRARRAQAEMKHQAQREHGAELRAELLWNLTVDDATTLKSACGVSLPDAMPK